MSPSLSISSVVPVSPNAPLIASGAAALAGSRPDSTSITASTASRKRQRQWSPGQEEDEDEDEDDDLGDGDGDGDGWPDHGLASSSPKRKKGKGASRPISVSCEKCKERKVKCDRGQPRCGWCARNGQTCEYKERKKPGLRAGYGRELESRLDGLEGILMAHDRLLQQWTSASQNGMALAVPQVASPVGQQHVSQAETALFMQPPGIYSHATTAPARYENSPNGQMQHASAHRYADSQASLHISPTASGDIYPPSNPPLESPSLNMMGTGGVIHETSLPTPPADQDFPPYDLLYALTDLFFKHINTWCPILHRRTTLDALFGPSPLEEADRILLHAIVATTLRFSTDVRLTDAVRERHHAMSKQKVLLYGLENSSVKALQAMVILALDIVGNSNGPPGWNLLALITRGVVQLGLAVEATSASVAPVCPSIYTLRAMVLPEPKSFIEDETRRRLFWMVFLLDRYATISTAFDFALDEKEIDRKLPCRDDLFARNQPVETRWFPTAERHDSSVDKPENLGAFGYYIEMIGILSQIHRFLKKPVDIGALSDVEEWQQEYRELDTKLTTWKFRLPSEYANVSRLFQTTAASAKVANCILVMLHVTYHTTAIRLHSSAAYPTTRSPIFTPSFSASQRCRSAVDEICTICTYVNNNNVLTKLGPPFAFSLWVAARVLLVHGSTIDHDVNPAIHPLIDTLHKMGAYWQVAERYATLLSRVMEEYSESQRAAANDDSGAPRETPSTVRILSDMRRTAYDLDFLISRQPRQVFAPASATNKTASFTPATARTPAPNELDYLDVFDFFNFPRLPVTGASAADINSEQQNDNTAGGYINDDHNHRSNVNGVGGGSVSGANHDNTDVISSNEFNITNFMYDANADWFSKGPDDG